MKGSGFVSPAGREADDTPFARQAPSASPTAPDTRRIRLFRPFRLIVAEHLPVFVPVTLFFLLALLFQVGVGPGLLVPPSGSEVPVVFAALAALIYRWWSLIRRGRGAVAAVRETARWETLIPLVGGGFLVSWLHLVELQVFLQWKSRIPEIHPFTLDPALARLDRWVHLGHDPWQLLQPILGYPSITLALDRVYVAWFVVLTLVVLWQAFATDRVTRIRFFTTYALSWILVGIVLGILLSSAGPIFYADVVGEDGGYGEMLAYLAEVHGDRPLQAMALRELLWDNYLQRGTIGVGGIAAMPSLHVGLSLLFAIVGWRRNRVLGVALGAFGFGVFLATIHLGWHYAIDGYVGAGAVWAIWVAVGWWLGGRPIIDRRGRGRPTLPAGQSDAYKTPGAAV